jgi:hypothetical protein
MSDDDADRSLDESLCQKERLKESGAQPPRSRNSSAVAHTIHRAHAMTPALPQQTPNLEERGGTIAAGVPRCKSKLSDLLVG